MGAAVGPGAGRAAALPADRRRRGAARREAGPAPRRPGGLLRPDHAAAQAPLFRPGDPHLRTGAGPDALAGDRRPRRSVGGRRALPARQRRVAGGPARRGAGSLARPGAVRPPARRWDADAVPRPHRLSRAPFGPLCPYNPIKYTREGTTMRQGLALLVMLDGVLTTVFGKS